MSVPLFDFQSVNPNGSPPSGGLPTSSTGCSARKPKDESDEREHEQRGEQCAPIMTRRRISVLHRRRRRRCGGRNNDSNCSAGRTSQTKCASRQLRSRTCAASRRAPRPDRGGRAALQESLDIARKLRYRELTAYCLGGLGQLAMLGDDPEQAAKMLGASEQLFAEVGAAIDPDETETQRKVLAWANETIGAAAVDELRKAGADTPLDQLLEPQA